MPSALTWFLGFGKWTQRLDLTGYTKVRLHIFMAGASGASGSKARLLYRPASSPYSSTVTDFSTIGATEVEMPMDSGLGNLVSSSWINLVAGAKADVYVGLAGVSGDNAADPQIHRVSVEFE